MFQLTDLNMLLENHRNEITQWMKQKRSEVPVPIYGSVDIRDSGWKIAVVDANHFPAGFNNTPLEDHPKLASLFHEHIQRTYPVCQWVHIYPESHTRNQAYVENIATIQRIIETAGYKCTIGSPELAEHGSMSGLSGPLELQQCEFDDDGHLLVEGRIPDVVLLNNDLTEGAFPGLETAQITPPPHMGWYQRRKSEHYTALKPYVEEISEMLGIDSWHIMPDWFVSENKCLTEDACRQRLAIEIDDFLEKLRSKYESLGIHREPRVVFKNDSGTYGLGILILSSGQEILNLSNRKANKLRYSKGGAQVENFLIQEGIPTALETNQGEVLEPVVYLVDGEAASWFYRINAKKSDMENLNSPSARFEHFSGERNPFQTSAHSWHALVAELSMLAMGAEALQRQHQH